MPAKKTTAKTTRATRSTAAARATTKARASAPRARKATPPKAVAKAEPVAALRRTRRRALVGNVVGDRTPKTVIVEVTRLRQHPLYKKVIRVRKRYPTHDPNEDARLGDLVRIEEGRPFSATKRFRVAEVLSRAAEAREAAPRVAQVEAALEELEGVTALLPAKRQDGDAEKTEEDERA